MIRTTTEKRNGKRGATIVIAMLVFLLCALAGASVYLMAASNMGRYSHADEQQYYSVSSAALMFVDMLDDLTYTSPVAEFVYEKSWDYTDNKHNESETNTLNIPTSALGELLGTLEGATTIRTNGLKLCEKIGKQCDKVFPFLYVPAEWYNKVTTPTRPLEPASLSTDFTVTVRDSERYGTVRGRLAMNANCDLLLTFDNGDGAYAITVYWVANVSVERTEDPIVYEYAEKDASGAYVKGTQKQRSTVRVKATWPKEKVTISRGEAIANV